jgi:hypothetical protein
MLNIGSTPGGAGAAGAATGASGGGNSALAVMTEAERARRLALQDIISADGVFASGVLEDPEGRREKKGKEAWKKKQILP